MVGGGRRGRPRLAQQHMESGSPAPETPVVEKSPPKTLVSEPATLNSDPSPIPSNSTVLSRTQGTRSTFASLVDPGDDTELQYFPRNETNGSTRAKLVHEDVIDDINYWKNVVLCTVLGANPPSK